MIDLDSSEYQNKVPMPKNYTVWLESAQYEGELTALRGKTLREASEAIQDTKMFTPAQRGAFYGVVVPKYSTYVKELEKAWEKRDKEIDLLVQEELSNDFQLHDFPEKTQKVIWDLVWHLAQDRDSLETSLEDISPLLDCFSTSMEN